MPTLAGYDRGMSHIYETTMSPSKYELLAAWLPSQPWFSGNAARLKPVGAYRFDDPEGEVGLEGHLFTAGNSTVFHVPLSYRGAPLEGGEEFLVGTSEHGVLGTRWISDAVGDPVFRAALANVITQHGTGSREFIETKDGTRTERDPSVRVVGNGHKGADVPELWAARVTELGQATVAETEFASLAVHRVVDLETPLGDDPEGITSLRGSWDSHPERVLLASLQV